MKNRLKVMYQLTDKGAKQVEQAIFSSMFMYVSYMLPMFLIMYFASKVLEEDSIPIQNIGIGIFSIIVIMSIFVYISYNKTYSATYGEARDLRITLAEKLRSLPLSYFSQHDISDVSQTLMRDVADIEHALSHAVPQYYGFGLAFLLIAIMLLLGNIYMGLSVIVPIIMSMFCLLLSKKVQIRETTKYHHVLRENSEKFQEAIELQQEIKSFNRNEEVVESVIKSIEASEKVHIKSELAQAIPVTLAEVILHLTIGSVILTGAALYSKGNLSLLYFIGYVLAAARITDSIKGMNANIAEILYLDARVKKIKEFNETRVQEGNDEKIMRHDIEFKEVGFSYSKDSKVLQSLSFLAEPNQVTALVGPSGCGKTSVLRLISRLYDYDEGEILLGGKDIKGLSVESLFEKISIVFQDVMLFNNTIMENIRIGRKDASDEDVRKAAKLAHCDEFIEKLPDGYQTLIGENGSKLSGGERQRISIARAFLKDAPIILLDEISASLDIENEKQIQESLNTLIENKTVVIVSHRLKSIENADKIIVMKEGEIEKIGKHKDLFRSSPTYRKMLKNSNMIEEYTY